MQGRADVGDCLLLRLAGQPQRLRFQLRLVALLQLVDSLRRLWCDTRRISLIVLRVDSVEDILPVFGVIRYLFERSGVGVIEAIGVAVE